MPTSHWRRHCHSCSIGQHENDTLRWWLSAPRCNYLLFIHFFDFDNILNRPRLFSVHINSTYRVRQAAYCFNESIAVVIYSFWPKRLQTHIVLFASAIRGREKNRRLMDEWMEGWKHDTRHYWSRRHNSVRNLSPKTKDCELPDRRPSNSNHFLSPANTIYTNIVYSTLEIPLHLPLSSLHFLWSQIPRERRRISIRLNILLLPSWDDTQQRHAHATIWTFRLTKRDKYVCMYVYNIYLPK